MLHTSMPLRPRVNVRCEYLVTPVSVISAPRGKKILCLTDIKSAGNGNEVSEYVQFLTQKVGAFDRVMKDSDPEFLGNLPHLVRTSLLPYKKCVRVRTCTCGAYEELTTVRMFDLRRVTENRCVFCGVDLEVRTCEVLFADLNWPEPDVFSCNQTWVRNDLENFLGRQTVTYKISKQNEPVRLPCDGSEFGVRYQILWAALLVYLARMEREDEIVLHYVQRVQDKAFFVCSLAKIMCPQIKIHLNALPLVWMDESPTIVESSPSHIKLLGKALNTKRKELRVSLRSWRY